MHGLQEIKVAELETVLEAVYIRCFNRSQYYRILYNVLSNLFIQIPYPIIFRKCFCQRIAGGFSLLWLRLDFEVYFGVCYIWHHLGVKLDYRRFEKGLSKSFYSSLFQWTVTKIPEEPCPV